MEGWLDSEAPAIMSAENWSSEVIDGVFKGLEHR